MFELNIERIERNSTGTYLIWFYGCHCLLDVSSFGTIWSRSVCRNHTCPVPSTVPLIFV
jgi:hypothetical protein